jgi:hypothetical protein
LDSVSAELIDGYRFAGGTIFDALDDRCMDWEIFEGDELPQVFAISEMNLSALEGHFTDFEDFVDRVSQINYAPSYIFIEPNYGNILPTTAEDFTCGTSQHPLDDVTRGEGLIKKVYETIRNSPIWKSSVLLVTYDEHGAFFDHVHPPPAVPPGDSIINPPNSHFGFDFARLGVRVPAVVVSPFIPRGIVDHTQYDHTSLLRSVEKLFGIGSITNRDAAANDFLYLFSLKSMRTDAPLTLPEPHPHDPALQCDDEERIAATTEGLTVATDKQGGGFDDFPPAEPLAMDEPNSIWGFVHVAFRKHLSVTPIRERQERKRIIRRYLSISNEQEARTYLLEARQAVRYNKGVNELSPPRKSDSPPSGSVKGGSGKVEA